VLVLWAERQPDYAFTTLSAPGCQSLCLAHGQLLLIHGAGTISCCSDPLWRKADKMELSDLQKCVMQAWTASAYGCLPSPASLYGGPMSIFASKSSLHRLDGLHWALAGALGLVSAALGLYIMKGHTLQKQVNSSSTELSRLLLKVSADGFILTQAAFRWSSLACAQLHCWTILSSLDKLDVNMLFSTFDDAGHQPAAVSAVPRACANHPPHKQHVSHDTLPSHSHAVIWLSMNFETARHGFGLYHNWIFICVPYFF